MSVGTFQCIWLISFASTSWMLFGLGWCTGLWFLGSVGYHFLCALFFGYGGVCWWLALSGLCGVCVCVCGGGGGRGGVCLRAASKVESASLSEVYSAGKLQRHFTCGFSFRHDLSLWLSFKAAFGALKGLMTSWNDFVESKQWNRTWWFFGVQFVFFLYYIKKCSYGETKFWFISLVVLYFIIKVTVWYWAIWIVFFNRISNINDKRGNMWCFTDFQQTAFWKHQVRYNVNIAII